MRLRDEAGLATGQAGSASGRRSASWRFLGLTLAAISGYSRPAGSGYPDRSLYGL